ncbi:MAG TPA: glycosyltransferase family 4 protein [Gemmataceae bacterium]|nr:glycosyltransferase family 4 protein [Gemmataceae bacterium]
MKASRITVLRDGKLPEDLGSDATVLTFAELCRELRSLRAVSHLFRYRAADLYAARLAALRRPFLTALLMRFLSRGSCRLVDETGEQQPVTPRYLARRFGQMVRDFARQGRVLRQVERDINELSAMLHPQRHAPLDRSAPPVYLRTDLVYDLSAGGSVSHTAGVLNNLAVVFGPPLFFTTDCLATVDPTIPTQVIRPAAAFWDFPHVPALVFSGRFARRVRRLLGERRPAFFYQRYCLNNYSGVQLAQVYRVPLVLEYNGSEVWINRHWGKRPARRYERLSERIERLNLMAADLIVVVSRPLRDEVAAAGIPAEKVLVNPNGVDPKRYSPDVDGSPVRRRYGWDGHTVIGFIGTFGPWHGPEVLVEAVGLLLRECPSYRRRIRLLLIGDGAVMPQVCGRIATYALGDVCICTGLVPQHEGPGYLAACDILVAPHVPNPDGSAFFGSPTKLFEYMAMGKGIVASDLGQIGEVLEHDRTAWLVRPGCAASLAAGLKVLIDDPQRRARLGAAARQTAAAHHSWRRHTERIVQALQERCLPEKG